MIKEAIDRILGLAPPNISSHGDLEYSDKGLHLITPPLPGGVVTDTLQGLADLFEAGIDGLDPTQVLIHILKPTVVQIISTTADKYGRRRLWAEAQYPTDIKQFPFGGFMSIENFIIGVQAGFQRVVIEKPQGGTLPDLDYVVQMASKITNEAIRVNSDDGVSQQVSVKQGIALQESQTIKPRVSLAPYRTFAEIDQVVSEFVFRARISNGDVQLALFEADGGRWRIAATKAIAEWCADKFGTAPIIS